MASTFKKSPTLNHFDKPGCVYLANTLIKVTVDLQSPNFDINLKFVEKSFLNHSMIVRFWGKTILEKNQ